MFERTSTRLWTLAGIGLCGLVALGSAGFYGLNHINAGSASALRSTNQQLETLVLLEHAQTHLHGQVIAWKNILLRGHDAENYNRYVNQFQKEEGLVRSYLKQVVDRFDGQSANISQINAIIDLHLSLAAKYRNALSKFDSRDHLAGHRVDDLVLAIETEPLEKAALLIKQVEEQANTVATAGVSHSQELYQTTLQLFGVLILLSGCLSIIFSLWIIRSLTRELGGEPAEASSIARRIAAGELNFPIKTRVGDSESLLASMQSMQLSIRDAVSEVRSGADTLFSSTSRLATSCNEVAKSSVTQAIASSQTNEAMERITRQIAEIFEIAQGAEASANHSGRLASEGATVVFDAVCEMESIAEAVRNAATKVSKLGEDSRQIFAIVSAIREIADQTNLLALNAAIEAARAGEQGRGFAVVADEVRKLAERTASATQEINFVIHKVEALTVEAVNVMDHGNLRVAEGVVKAKKAGKSMADIHEASEHLINAVTEISRSLSEQSAASVDVAEHVEQIRDLSQQNGVAVKTIAEGATHIEQLAQSLQSLTGRFRV